MRQQLPVYQFRKEILQAVENSSVVVVAGETGSGKSTQVPQFILEVMVVSLLLLLLPLLQCSPAVSLGFTIWGEIFAYVTAL